MWAGAAAPPWPPSPACPPAAWLESRQTSQTAPALRVSLEIGSQLSLLLALSILDSRMQRVEGS